MDTMAERDRVRKAIRGLLEADRATGALKDPVEYKKPFPGFWDIVAEEYEEFVVEMKGTQASPAPSRDTVRVEGATTAPPLAPSPPPSPPKEDRIGPYRLLKELGRGGMGVVYLAEDARIKRKVALKMLSPQFASSKHLLMRFQREAEVASRIDHPNVCAVYDADVAGEIPYIAMRYVEGKTLQEWIAVSKAPTGEVPPGEAPHTVTRLPGVGNEETAPAPKPTGRKAATTSGIHKREEIVRIIHLMEKAARALHVAHETGLLHRDIKPGNIMVTSEGEPVLLDFGLARADDEESHQLTQTGSLMGTPAYMSPEQLTAQRIKLDRRTDVYSLGATLYECLTLKLPFEAPTLEALYQKILATDPENARKVNPAIPDDLRVVLETALEKDRGRRYQTAFDFAEDLRRVREFEPITAKPPPLTLRAYRWTQRNRVVSVLIVCLLAGFAGAAYLWKQTATALHHAQVTGLIAASAEAQDRDPVLSVLLAREAFRLLDTPEAETRLRDACDQSFAESVSFLRQGASRVEFSPTSDRVLQVLRNGSVWIQSVNGADARALHEPSTRTASHVLDARFSPDGSLVVAGHSDNQAVVYNLSGEVKLRLGGHSSPVRGALFSPKADRILTLPEDGTARLWERSGDPGPALAVGGSPLVRCAFSPDGERIIGAAADGSVHVFDAEGGRVARCDSRGVALIDAQFSPNSERILAAYSDGVLRQVAPSGEVLLEFRAHQAPLTSATWSPSGRFILTTSEDRSARVWVSADGREVGSYLGHPGAVLGGTFSASEDRVLTFSRDGSAAVWDLDRGDSLMLRGHRSEVVAGRFADTSRVVTVDSNGGAWIWDLRERQRVESPWEALWQSDARLHVRGDRVLCVSRRRFQILDLSGRVRFLSERLFSDPLATFSEDGERILLCGRASGRLEATIRDTDGTVLGRLDTDGLPRFAEVAIAISERGNAAVSPKAAIIGLRESPPWLWNLETGQSQCLSLPVETTKALQKDWAKFGSTFVGLAPTSGNAVAVMQSGNNRVRLWDSTGQFLREISVELVERDPLRMTQTREAPAIDTVVFSRDESHLLACCHDSRVILLDSQGKVLFVCGENRSSDTQIEPDGSKMGIVYCPMAEFAPDGRTFVTAVPYLQDEWIVRVRDLSGAEVARLVGHEGPVTSARFSPNGDRIVTASQDRTVRVWDITGKQLEVFRGHVGAVRSARFSPKGDAVVSAGGEGAVRIWRLGSGDLRALADQRAIREFNEFEKWVYRGFLPAALQPRQK